MKQIKILAYLMLLAVPATNAIADCDCTITGKYIDFCCYKDPESSKFTVELCEQAQRREHEEPGSVETSWSMEDGENMSVDGNWLHADVKLKKPIAPDGSYNDTVVCKVYIDGKLHTTLRHSVSFYVIKVEIITIGPDYTGAIDVCKQFKPYSISLSEDSTDDVKWEAEEGLAGNGSGSSFTFKPTKSDRGVYTVTAISNDNSQCKDSAVIHITEWKEDYPWKERNTDQEYTFSHDYPISPNIIANNIIDATNVDELWKQAENAEQELRDWINAKIKELAQKPQYKNKIEQWLSIPGNTMDKLGAILLSKAKSKVLKRMKSFRKKGEAAIRKGANKLANTINKSLTTNYTASTKYIFDCSSYNPANPGWEDLQVTAQKNEVGGMIQPIGFNLSVGVNFIVQINIPIKGKLKLDLSAWTEKDPPFYCEGPHKVSRPKSTTIFRPSVFYRFKPSLEISAVAWLAASVKIEREEYLDDKVLKIRAKPLDHPLGVRKHTDD